MMHNVEATAVAANDTPSIRAPTPVEISAHSRISLAVFVLAYLLSIADRHLLSMLVEPIKADLHLNDIEIGLLQGFAFSALYAVVGVPLGMLADRMSRKRIMAAGVIVWSACTAFCGLSSNFLQIFLMRMGVGAGEAALTPAVHSSLSDSFPRNKLAGALSVYMLGTTIGAGFSLILGGAIVEAISREGAMTLPVFGTLPAWRAAFVLIALPGIIVAALLLLTKEPVRTNAKPVARTFDIRPLLACMRANSRVFMSIYATSVLLAAIGGLMVAWYPVHLMRKFGLGPAEVGHRIGWIFMVAGTIGTLSAGRISGWLADRGSHDANMRLLAIIGLAMTIPAFAAPLMPDLFSFTLCFIPLSLLFFGYFTCASAAVQLATPSALRATNAGVFLLANSMLGISTGSAIVPIVDGWIYGRSTDLSIALAIVSAVCSLAAGIFAIWGRRQYGERVAALG